MKTKHTKTYGTQWHKAVLRRRFRDLKAFIKKSENSQIKSLVICPLEPLKKKANPQVSLQKEILKIKTEINEMETKLQRISETELIFWKDKQNLAKKPREWRLK